MYSTVVLLSLFLLASATADFKTRVSSRTRLASRNDRSEQATTDDTVPLRDDDDQVERVTIGRLSSPDGRRATILDYKDILAKDTRLPSYMEITLRQITDGNRVAQAVIGPFGNIMDCDVSLDESAVDRFSNEFMESQMKVKPENITVVPIQLLDTKHRQLVNLHKLVKSCHEYQRELYMGARRQLSKSGKSRSKRSVIFPGTKWCGKGDEATRYTSLGNNANTDRCCRMHDHCPYTITGFTQKYGIFNYRFHTVSHCDCDYSFRTCLKTAGSGTANMIGTIYFNVVRLPCFVFVPKLTCVERTWWGKCEKHAHKYVAEVQEALNYNSYV